MSKNENGNFNLRRTFIMLRVAVYKVFIAFLKDENVTIIIRCFINDFLDERRVR
jgi:hypothetical protein